MNAVTQEVAINVLPGK